MKTYMRAAFFVVGLVFLGFVQQASAATITVNTVSDASPGGDGACSLREAISNANSDTDSTLGDCVSGEASPTVDVIEFNLVGSAPFTITPSVGYNITSTLTIDGTSQAGTSCPLAGGSRALQINIDGQNIVSSAVFSINTGGDGSTIKGLAIYGATDGGGIYSSADDITVQCNNIGTDSEGLTSLPNQHGIVFYSDAITVTSGHLIGGPGVDDGNLISGNGYGDQDWYGIGVFCNANDLTIQGNWIGLDITGHEALANSAGGISCGNGGLGNAPVSNISILDNVISGNGILDDQYSPGIGFGGSEEPGFNSPASNITIQGNIIGLSADQLTALPNENDGIYLGTETNDVTIGGTIPSQRNVISGNGANGLAIGYIVDNITVQGNLIGLNTYGDSKPNEQSGVVIGNTGTGTSVTSVTNITIANNSISGHQYDAIQVEGASAVSITGNVLGLGLLGTTCMQNSVGIQIYDDSQVTIGGTTPGDRNIIGCNNHGIEISGTDVGTTVDITGNWIGIGSDGSAKGNSYSGIYIKGNVTGSIGGTAIGEGNTISNNSIGISVLQSTEGVFPSISILGNSMVGNTSLGIDLAIQDTNEGQTTPNDPLDADSGPNSFLNYPVILSTVQNESDTIATYSVDIPVGLYRVEFFTNPTEGIHSSGNGEGELFIDSDTITVTEPGVQIFQKTLADTNLDDAITTTITRCNPGCISYVETSEFSNSAPPGVDYGSASGSQTSLADNGAVHIIDTIYLGRCVNGDSGDGSNGDGDGVVQPGALLGTSPCTDDRDGVVFVDGDVTITPGSVSGTQYIPAGPGELDDAIFSGEYTGSHHYNFLAAVLDTSGPADLFVYVVQDPDTEALLGISDPIAITPGEPQLLQDGVYLTFQNATGHTITNGTGGSLWATEVFPPQVDFNGGYTERTDPYTTNNQVILLVTASASGVVNGWVDLNDDGDFSDTGEHVVNNTSVAAGDNGVVFTAPDTPGTHQLRMRYTSYTPAEALPYGLETDGEVEDYGISFAAPIEEEPAPVVRPGGIVPIGCIDPQARNFSTQVVINTGCVYSSLFQNITPSQSATSTTPSSNTTDCKPGYNFSPTTGARCPVQTKTTFVFTKNLKLGMTDPEVKQLQIYLNNHGYEVTASPKPGSLGQETNYFGPATQAALAKFQKASGITPAAGYFGPLTRAYIGKGR